MHQKPFDELKPDQQAWVEKIYPSKYPEDTSAAFNIIPTPGDRLRNAEGEIIRNWIKDKLEHIDGERREELKNVYNNAMKNSYEKAKKGNLYVKEFTDNLNKIDLMPQKIEAMELCFKVMAADGVAEKKEMKLLHDLSEKLDLDWKEIEKFLGSEW